MAEIALTRDQVAIVDEADLLMLSGFRWCSIRPEDKRWYAVTYVYPEPADWRVKRCIYMHRMLLGAGRGQEVDHVNGDGIDNRRCNLRLCDRTSNARNMKTKSMPGKTSRYKGVYWSAHRGKWVACICLHYRSITVGAFAQELDAAMAYDAAARSAFGEFAHPNFPEGRGA